MLGINMHTFSLQNIWEKCIKHGSALIYTLSQGCALSPSLQREEYFSFSSDRFSQVQCHTGSFKYISAGQCWEEKASCWTSQKKLCFPQPQIFSHSFINGEAEECNAVWYNDSSVLCLMTLNLMPLSLPISLSLIAPRRYISCSPSPLLLENKHWAAH